jgi:hypothetical protein
VELTLGTPSPGTTPTPGPSSKPSTDKPVW